MPATHYRAAMIGSFVSGTWLGEIASTGFQGPGTDGGAWGNGHIDAGLESFNASPTADSGTTTHFNVSYGSVGTGCWNKTNQNAIAELCWSFLDALKGWQSTDFRWNEVRLSAVEADGKIVNGASVFTMLTPLAGTATMNLPPQNAIVASLGTGGRGPRNRGRMYLPVHTNNVIATGALIGSTANALARSTTKTLIDGVNGLTNVRMSVVSQKYQTFSDINRVRCGDEIDAQRRRREGRLEIYSSTAVTS